MRQTWKVALGATLALAGGPSASARAQTTTALVAGGRYEASDLGDLGKRYIEVSAMNAAGAVVGTSRASDGIERAFVLEGGRLTDLQSLGGARSWACAINAGGTVAGCSQGADGRSHAAIWRRDSSGRRSIEDLGVLGKGRAGQGVSLAYAINDQGVVVGMSVDAGKGVHAIRWEGGVMNDLGTLGGQDARACAINDAGTIAGYDGSSSVDTRPCVWRDERVAAIPGAAGPHEVHLAINQSGVIVGTLNFKAVRIDPSGPVALGGLEGERSGAAAVNSAGVIAGWAVTASGETHACVWEPRKGASGYDAIDLDTLGTGSSYAGAINDRGWIAGAARSRGGKSHLVIWRPVGERR